MEVWTNIHPEGKITMTFRPMQQKTSSVGKDRGKQTSRN
jgi:hypothetical protein